MKKIFLISLCLVLSLSLAVSVATAKKAVNGKNLKSYNIQSVAPTNASDSQVGIQRASAQGTTTWLASYTFDSGPSCVTEGWTSEDITAPLKEFFHVADGVELDGGDFGALVALQGSQSLWCGQDATGSSPYCGYAVLPGYGNGWDQAWCTKLCLNVDSLLSVGFMIMWDSEPSYDQSFLEIDSGCVNNWQTVATANGGAGLYDGFGTDTTIVVIPDSTHGATAMLRWHFTADGGWSDEDGLWNTDGAILLDSLYVNDKNGVVLAAETFEDETPGVTQSNDWGACSPAGYGDYSGLAPGASLILEDPCLSNFSCMWTFFQGSTDNYGCGGFPGQTAMPYGNNQGQYLANEVWSPSFAWVGSGTIANLQFESYRDLPLDNLQFYVWHVQYVDAGGCPSNWADRNFVYYGGQKDWITQNQGVGDLLSPVAITVRIALGAYDMCGVWCGRYGTGACHSHAPLLDNVEFYRVDIAGPVFSIRDLDMFQDNFAENGATKLGTARADCANDIAAPANPLIIPGDSISFTVADPVAGIDAGFGGDAAVYLYVSVDRDSGGAAYTPLQMQAPETKDAPASGLRFPYTGVSIAGGGRTWFEYQCDTAFTQPNRNGSVADRFCVDLNDNIFEPGDTIWYFLGATGGGTTNYDRASFAATSDINVVGANPDEFTMLPAGGYNNGGDILYVDGMNFRGAQPFFDSAFRDLGILDEIDRYDVRGPSSGVSNRPEGRVNATFAQLNVPYRKIVWNTGDLSITLGDGSGTPEKTDDYQLLLDWANARTNEGGVYLNGDDLAEQWAGYAGGGAVTYGTTYMTYTLVASTHNPPHGIAPLGTAVPGGMFDHSPVSLDTIVAYGGCNGINDFDMMLATGVATDEMLYNGTAGNSAVVAQKVPAPTTFAHATVLSGFSFHYIRDYKPLGFTARAEHMKDILTYLENILPDPTGAPDLSSTSLGQNYPNPFNPQTTIKYTIREKAHVSLRIYNVAGQLVKTLVDEVQTPESVSPITWNGVNNTGQSVSSGVYFYKLVTKNFTQTKKMVLLK